MENHYITLENREKITISKVDKETGKPIPGADAVFELRAKEDIVTADGTIRHKAGELVATLTTKDGVARVVRGDPSSLRLMDRIGMDFRNGSVISVLKQFGYKG